MRVAQYRDLQCRTPQANPPKTMLLFFVSPYALSLMGRRLVQADRR
jgi:hypothetical protein